VPEPSQPPSGLDQILGGGCSRALIATARRRSGKSGARYEDDTGAEELAGLRELGGDPLGMQNGCVVIGMVASDAIGTKTVFVDDMEEEAHAAELSRITAGFQVTKP
jgi:hypothetical protein